MPVEAEILAHYLSKEDAQILFPQPKYSTNEIVQTQCVEAVRQITAILRDDRLEDPECFMKINEIIRTLERSGISCGIRHDFG